MRPGMACCRRRTAGRVEEGQAQSGSGVGRRNEKGRRERKERKKERKERKRKKKKKEKRKGKRKKIEKVKINARKRV
jgi:hypothetical protein